jgi:hypothetical protein
MRRSCRSYFKDYGYNLRSRSVLLYVPSHRPAHAVSMQPVLIDSLLVLLLRSQPEPGRAGGARLAGSQLAASCVAPEGGRTGRSSTVGAQDMHGRLQPERNKPRTPLF